MYKRYILLFALLCSPVQAITTDRPVFNARHTYVTVVDCNDVVIQFEFIENQMKWSTDSETKSKIIEQLPSIVDEDGDLIILLQVANVLCRAC